MRKDFNSLWGGGGVKQHFTSTEVIRKTPNRTERQFKNIEYTRAGYITVAVCFKP
jgi:hypothetical protein